MFQIHLQTNLPILAKGQSRMQPLLAKGLKVHFFDKMCVLSFLGHWSGSSARDLQFLLKGSKKDSFRSFLYFAELNCFLLCSSTKPLDHVPTLQTTLWTTQLRASASNMRFEGHKKGQKTNKLRSCCQNVNQ